MFKFTSKKIALIAMFVAINVVLNLAIFEITFPAWKLTLSITICYFAGLFTGFIGGALTGFFGDMLGFLLVPSPFPYNPIFSLTSMLWGLVPGIIIDLYKLFSKKEINVLIGILILLFTEIVLFFGVSIGINSFVLWKSYYATMHFKDYLLIKRILPCFLDILVNFGISIILFVFLYKIPFFKEYLNVYKIENKVKEQVENNNADSTN